MSIGKDSIKRAVNNGYSNVKTAAPDMEHSEVLASVEPEVAPVVAPSEKAPQKKTPVKNSTACKTATQKSQPAPKAPVKRTAAPKKSVVSEKKAYVNVGENLPIWLL